MKQGVIVRGIGGFYQVQLDDTKEIIECKLRGRLRLQKSAILVGDRVTVGLVGENEGVIEETLPRVNQLIRPAIANVDQVVLVMATASPEPNLMLLDRILVLAESQGLECIICWNKADLDPQKADELIDLYAQIPYRVIATSAKAKCGIDELREALKCKTTTFAGPSGVGKSSLLNALHPGLKLTTGEVSVKLQRGKHTTRSVELIPLDCGGLVADTPGFSQMQVPSIQPDELGDLFPEIASLASECFFRRCLHTREPKCAVKKGVAQHRIPVHRYQHYLVLLDEVVKQNQY